MIFKFIVKATNATMYLGFGFKPRHVRILNLTDRTGLEFATDFRAGVLAETHYGISRAAAGDLAAITTEAAGLALYAGGDVMSAASTAYHKRDDKDRRAAYDSNAPITSFTIGSVANKTGNFNVEAHTTYVGPGAIVIIGGQEFVVVAMTSNGEQANEVTLASVPDGAVAGKVYAVDKIRGRYDLVGAVAGDVIPAGITIGASATVNDTSGDILYIEADSE